jgi:sodium transport system permease protein
VSTLLAVFRKEFVENLRDRRTVLTALLFGPLFGPLFFSLMLQFSLDRSRLGTEQAVRIAVVHPERAPNLLAFLQARRVVTHALAGEESAAREAIATHRERVVLEITPQFGEHLDAGRPAVLRLYADSSRSGDAPYAQRIAALVAVYGQQIASQRLMLRGIDPRVTQPLAVQSVDVATPAARAQLLLGMLSFFMILSLLTGGMYLAIDTTMGERERGTLEPLLAAPVPRESLLLGKLLATGTYMLLSLSITTSALCLALGRIDLGQFGMSADLGARTAISLILLTAPLIPLMAAGMTLIAAWTRSAREAQAWLGVLQLIPTLPLVFAGLLNLTATTGLMLVPSLSQHLLITRLLRGEPLHGAWLALSVGVSLALGALLVWAAARVYHRERLLV